MKVNLGNFTPKTSPIKIVRDRYIRDSLFSSEPSSLASNRGEDDSDENKRFSLVG